MSIFSFLTQSQNRKRKANDACVSCESLEGRELLTAIQVKKPLAVSKSSVRSLKTPKLGKPSPTQSSIYAHLAAPANSPKVFRDAAAARVSEGLDGTGMTVAFIDTGVNYNLDSLGKGLGSAYQVIAGFDFGMNDVDPMPTWSHGKSVPAIPPSTKLPMP
jgi:subtilisin family serine protease